MAHEVFISYSSKDREVADAVCAALEARGVSCWIAPRDVPPGADWNEMNARAIAESRLMTLVFSSRADASQQVRRKVKHAVERGLPIAVFRIEDVTPSPPLKNHLAAARWLDALPPPPEAHLDRLVETITPLLAERGGPPGRTPSALAAETPERVARERRGVNRILLATSVLGVLALAALVGVMAYRWSRSGGGGDGDGRGDGTGGGRRAASAETSDAAPPLPAPRCNPPENHGLRCRGGGEIRLSIGEPGESGRRLLRIRFRRGSQPATAGLNPGECAWLDRAVKEEEPDTIIRYVSGPNVPVVVHLGDASKYWDFCASNRGDYLSVLESGPAN